MRPGWTYETTGQPWIERPLKLRFAFDDVEHQFMENDPEAVYPSTGKPYSSNVGILSPWYGKTKFYMIVSEVNSNEVVKGNVPSVGDFQLFSKDNSINLSSPVGYYAQVKIQNNSKVKSEMFAVSVDAFESSK